MLKAQKAKIIKFFKFRQVFCLYTLMVTKTMPQIVNSFGRLIVIHRAEISGFKSKKIFVSESVQVARPSVAFVIIQLFWMPSPWC